ncbi:MAG: hypothetical protein COB02_15280 [Candidatus Cloacimonadota bacterium]|nr:MAG: hypothetical protein COB02_15280 [Candidatus Cloacimonadota bacterium]
MKILISITFIFIALFLSGCVQTMEKNSIAIAKSDFLMDDKGKKLIYDLGIKTSKNNFSPLIAVKTRVPSGMSFEMKAKDKQLNTIIDIAYLFSKKPQVIKDIAQVQISPIDKKTPLSKLKINLTVIGGYIKIDAKSIDKLIPLTLSIIKAK